MEFRVSRLIMIDYGLIIWLKWANVEADVRVAFHSLLLYSELIITELLIIRSYSISPIT